MTYGLRLWYFKGARVQGSIKALSQVQARTARWISGCFRTRAPFGSPCWRTPTPSGPSWGSALWVRHWLMGWGWIRGGHCPSLSSWGPLGTQRGRPLPYSMMNTRSLGLNRPLVTAFGTSILIASPLGVFHPGQMRTLLHSKLTSNARGLMPALTNFVWWLRWMLLSPRPPPSKRLLVPSSSGVGYRLIVLCLQLGGVLLPRSNTSPFSWASLWLCHGGASSWLCFWTPCLLWRPYWTPVLGQGRSSP
jgi:hypothetical protein